MVLREIDNNEISRVVVLAQNQAGQELISFKHNNQITGVAVSPNGRIIASGSNNIRLRFAVDPATSDENKTARLRSLIADPR